MATPLSARTATGRAVFIREVKLMIVPEMTIGKTEQEKERENLLMENKELTARCNAYEEQLRAAREESEKAYMHGRIDGLEFAIRYNGSSGKEVSKA